MIYQREEILRALHPLGRQVFRDLTSYLEAAYKNGQTATDFRPFEGLRTPGKQQELFDKRPVVTHVGPWASPHQYGLAVDFVPYTGRAGAMWSWADNHDWHFLQVAAERHSLKTIGWDRPHVEHPIWGKLASFLRNPT